MWLFISTKMCTSLKKWVHFVGARNLHTTVNSDCLTHPIVKRIFSAKRIHASCFQPLHRKCILIPHNNYEISACTWNGVEATEILSTGEAMATGEVIATVKSMPQGKH